MVFQLGKSITAVNTTTLNFEASSGDESIKVRTFCLAVPRLLLLHLGVGTLAVDRTTGTLPLVQTFCCNFRLVLVLRAGGSLVEFPTTTSS